MGAGISLSKNQIIEIKKNQLKKQFEIEQALKPKYDANGYEIFYDFSEEKLLFEILKDLDDLKTIK